MKKNLFILILAVSTFFTFNGCKKTTAELLGTLSATVGGTAWQSTTQSGLLYSNYITIAGLDLAGKDILITIHGIVPGTYTLNALAAQVQTEAVFKVKNADNSTTEYIATQGSVAVSSVSDNRISGTFNFTLGTVATPPVPLAITNGTFTNVLLVSGK